MDFENQHKQQEDYSREQLERWKQGADNYKDFWRNFDQGDERYGKHMLGQVQAMFLGEKPAVFYSRLLGTLWQKLTAAGYETVPGYVYDPIQVAKVINDHPGEFPQFEHKTPEAVMKFLAQADKKENSTIRGLILGIPYEAVKYFEKRQSLANELKTQIEVKEFSAHGIIWSDSASSQVSINGEQRIIDAFAKSGILEDKK